MVFEKVWAEAKATVDQEDYDVLALFVTNPHSNNAEDSEFWDESVGSVSLKEDAMAKDMPHELEINGFTYKREDLI